MFVSQDRPPQKDKGPHGEVCDDVHPLDDKTKQDWGDMKVSAKNTLNMAVNQNLPNQTMGG